MDLRQRFAELNEEIRAYPTPIARCDDQLAGLLEERARIIKALEKQGGCTPLAVWTNDGGFDAA